MEMALIGEHKLFWTEPIIGECQKLFPVFIVPLNSG
jgi:hypothetical protein